MTKHESLHEHEGEVTDQPLEELLRQREREAQLLKEKRSAAAKKGWVTRRSAEGYSGRAWFVSRPCSCTAHRSRFMLGGVLPR